MSRPVRSRLSALILIAAFTVAAPLPVLAQAPSAGQAAFQQHRRPVVKRPVPIAGSHGSAPFVRTELYFGTARAEDVPVTEEEFHTFVDMEITPRFPDGLT